MILMTEMINDSDDNDNDSDDNDSNENSDDNTDNGDDASNAESEDNGKLDNEPMNTIFASTNSGLVDKNNQLNFVSLTDNITRVNNLTRGNKPASQEFNNDKAF
jgi:hypothetical protein